MESLMVCPPRTMRSFSMDMSSTDQHQQQQQQYSPSGRKMSSGSGPLSHEDVQLCQKTLAGMNAFRRCGKLCDVTLEVEGHNLPAHRVILASASPWLCEMLTSQEDSSGAPGSDDTAQQRHIKIHGVDYDSLNTLINFAYTGRLDVPSDKVTGVYRAAKRLKMQSAVDACSRFLITNLSPTNCIGIRSLASSCAELTAQTDLYIQNNLELVMNTSREFFALKKLRFDILGVEDSRLVPGGGKVMCELVVNWLQQTVKGQDIDAMTDEPHLLLLNAEGSLCDCLSLSQDSPACLDSVVRDYRNLGRCKQLAPVKVKEPKSPGASSVALSLANGVSLGSVQGGLRARSKSLEGGSPPTEWSLVAWHPVAERVCICVAVLDNRLVTMSLKLQNHLAITPPPQDAIDSSAVVDSGMPSPPISNGNGHLNGRGEPLLTRSLLQVAHMSAARCAMGVVVIGRQLVVLGGYDRGECLSSVESYEMQTNSWSSWPNMQQARGRFNAAALDGRLVACGGSTGSDDLRSVESYDPDVGKWSPLPDMLAALSNAGVAVLDNKLYVVGGSQGRSATSMCQMYDPVSNTWAKVADLNTERSQAAVCAVGDKLVVAGGSDFMNCLSSVEIYDPDTNSWEDSVAMVTSRRGAGVVFFMDKLYVIGGSDGQSSLSSVEIFDLSSQTWNLGPSLNTPRANVGVAVLDGRLFAIGGYNGKTFLDTVEYLMEDGHEWTFFMPVLTEPHTPVGNICNNIPNLGSMNNDDVRSC